MNIYEKLTDLQSRLKAPKGQYNKFGKYTYRSLEDITEASKPLLKELKLTLVVSDTPIIVGDRLYIQAEATLTNSENPEETIKASAYAREPATRKGMDDSQITGATSSYARKYCLNGLFSIDDNKDPDTQAPPETVKTINKAQVSELQALCAELGFPPDDTLLALSTKVYKLDSINSLPMEYFEDAKSRLHKKAEMVAA